MDTSDSATDTRKTHYCSSHTFIFESIIKLKETREEFMNYLRKKKNEDMLEFLEIVAEFEDQQFSADMNATSTKYGPDWTELLKIAYTVYKNFIHEGGRKQMSVDPRRKSQFDEKFAEGISKYENANQDMIWLTDLSFRDVANAVAAQLKQDNFFAFIQTEEWDTFLDSKKEDERSLLLQAITINTNLVIPMHKIMFSFKEVTSSYITEKEFQWTHCLYEEKDKLFQEKQSSKDDVIVYNSIPLNFISDITTKEGISNCSCGIYEFDVPYNIEDCFRIINCPPFLENEIPSVINFKTVKFLDVDMDTELMESEYLSRKYPTALKLFTLDMKSILYQNRDYPCCYSARYFPHLERYYIMRKASGKNEDFEPHLAHKALVIQGFFPIILNKVAEKETRISLLYCNFSGSSKQYAERVTKLASEAYYPSFMHAAKIYFDKNKNVRLDEHIMKTLEKNMQFRNQTLEKEKYREKSMTLTASIIGVRL